VTLNFSKRDIILIFLTAGLGFIGGIAAGVAFSSGQLPVEVSGLIIGLAVAVLTGLIALVRQIGDNILRSINHNTELTGQTLGAAQDAANHANERAQLIQDLQAERTGREVAERALHLIEIHPACIGCRQAVQDVLNQWRTWRQNDGDG
jgi:hypothetical protein